MTAPWFYLSFGDGSLPKGRQWFGSCFVKTPDDPTEHASARAFVRARRGPGGKAPSEDDVLAVAAIRRAHNLGINPGGEVVILPLETADIERIPPRDRERLLTREEAKAATRLLRRDQ